MSEAMAQFVTYVETTLEDNAAKAKAYKDLLTIGYCGGNLGLPPVI